MKNKAKAPAKKTAKPKGGFSSDDHRKLADKHRAKSQIHEARANLLDVDQPPPKKGKVTIRPY